MTGTIAASSIVAAIAMALLLLYVVDAAVAMSAGREGTGFLPMNEAQRGMILGGLSIILFFAAFAINWKANSKSTAILLIAGGAITGTAVLAAAAMGESMAEISTSFVGIIVIGYVIMGLGIWQAVRIRGYRRREHVAP
jgi:L-lactate permease